MVANYRVQAELTAIESTTDGNALVLGTVDGCVSVLAILDPIKSDISAYLTGMPSRDEGVSIVCSKYAKLSYYSLNFFIVRFSKLIIVD